MLMILFVTEIKIVLGNLLYQMLNLCIGLSSYKLQHSSDHNILYMDLYKEVWDLPFQKTFTYQNQYVHVLILIWYWAWSFDFILILGANRTTYILATWLDTHLNFLPSPLLKLSNNPFPYRNNSTIKILGLLLHQ